MTSRFHLHGARESCGQGLGGCCTVVVDGKAVSGCLSLRRFPGRRRLRTVEGIGGPGRLDPVQEAFVEAGAFQCGFCTPGFIMMVRQLLDQHPEPTDDEIRHYLVGNLCRCVAYPEMMDTVPIAAEKRAGIHG